MVFNSRPTVSMPAIMFCLLFYRVLKFVRVIIDVSTDDVTLNNDSWQNRNY